MRTNDTSTVLTENCEPYVPQDVVERLLQQKLRYNIAPFGLEVDCASLLQWVDQWDQPRFRHQNLVRELRAWSELLARKPLTFTYFKDPFALLDAPALTELVYAIGQNLKLLRGHHAEYGATLGHKDLTRQNLALLKGLDFNHVCLKVADEFDLQELRVHRQMLADYKFKYFSVELNFDSTSLDFLLRLMELLSFIEPTSICFSTPGAPFQHVDREGLTSLLMQFGYFLTESNSLLKFHSPLSKRPQDFLHLGPGGRGRFANLQLINFIVPIQYGERLDKNHLPIAMCF